YHNALMKGGLKLNEVSGRMTAEQGRSASIGANHMTQFMMSIEGQRLNDRFKSEVGVDRADVDEVDLQLLKTVAELSEDGDLSKHDFGWLGMNSVPDALRPYMLPAKQSQDCG
ncbi:MAG: hypothetical protein AAFY64_01455, partial [Pseudomonadota bacterium]